jgi:hypothetical protein
MRLNEWSIARKACEKSQPKGIDAGKIFSPEPDMGNFPASGRAESGLIAGDVIDPLTAFLFQKHKATVLTRSCVSWQTANLQLNPRATGFPCSP